MKKKLFAFAFCIIMVVAIAVPAFAAEPPQRSEGDTTVIDLTDVYKRQIHTDAIKENLIPQELSVRQMSIIYANEADVLNMALFGMTAKQWRDAHPDLKGNIRDYANVSQLVCLSNLENLNAVFINEGMTQMKRLEKLNAIAISQMKLLTEDHRILQLEAAKDS